MDTLGKSYVNDVYLILHDTNDKSGHLTEGITADELHQLMQDIPAGRKTLILDTHASERFIELAGREGSYALVLASDTAEIAYERRVGIAGEEVRCGMLTGALDQLLRGADAQTLSYGDWIASAIRIAEQASSQKPYPRRQTPYLSGIKSQCVFGPDDIFLSIFYFSVRHDWPEMPLEELTKLYSILRNTITVPHPHAHDAFGRAFLIKGATEQAAAALQTARRRRATRWASLLTLAKTRLHAGQFAGALAGLEPCARWRRQQIRPRCRNWAACLSSLRPAASTRSWSASTSISARRRRG